MAAPVPSTTGRCGVPWRSVPSAKREQDPHCLSYPVDIAIKACPGIHDPTTAVTTIDQLQRPALLVGLGISSDEIATRRESGSFPDADWATMFTQFVEYCIVARAASQIVGHLAMLESPSYAAGHVCDCSATRASGLTIDASYSSPRLGHCPPASTRVGMSAGASYRLTGIALIPYAE